MAYDESVVARIRPLVADSEIFSEKKMFGGIAFMLNGNMSIGVLDDMLVLRLGEEDAAKALKEKHTAPMTFTGKTIKSMIYVLPEGFKTEKDLKKWMQRCIDFVLTLPPK